MRYYRIELTDTNGSPINLASFGNQASPLPLSPNAVLESGVITSLLPDGTTNPAALNIEIDIEQLPLHIGDQNSYVRIYGLALSDVFRKDLNKQNISVKVGMSKGLPLANPAQQGLVIQGSIVQAFGNWLGTDMTLDMVIGAGGLTGNTNNNTPKAYVFTWTKGQKLSDAISQTKDGNDVLSKLKTDIQVSDDRTANEDKQGYYVTATQFAQLIQSMTVGQRGASDNGVYLYNDGQTFTARDTSTIGQNTSDAKQINFQDLIGQVTWYEPFKLTCKLVMRGDLELGGYVKFTDGANVITTAAAMPSLQPSRDRDQLGIASGGEFFIERIHHWGNFRQADAMSWNTTLGLIQTGQSRAV